MTTTTTGSNNSKQKERGDGDTFNDSYSPLTLPSMMSNLQNKNKKRQVKPGASRKEMKSFRTRHQHSSSILSVSTATDITSAPPTTATKGSLLQIKEREARGNAEARSFYLFWLDSTAALLVIFKHLITIESILSTILSAVATGLLFHYHDHWGDHEGYGGSKNFLILSFFLAMPVSTLLCITFNRREEGLQHISRLKNSAMAIYTCHATWTWKIKDDEQHLDRLDHSDECLRLLIDFGDTMTRFLTLPITGCPRHRETHTGRNEEATTLSAAYALFETTIGEYGAKLVLLTERMKECGFSPSEASRVRQTERMLLEAAEYLRQGKIYRTPQSMNALITFFVLFGPTFYAPAFSQIGYDFGSVWYGIAYAAIVSLSISALYEAVKIMEDPFVSHLTIDGINIYEELSIVYYLQLMRARKTIFPDAPEFDCTTTQAAMGGTGAARSSIRFNSSDLNTASNVVEEAAIIPEKEQEDVEMK